MATGALLAAFGLLGLAFSRIGSGPARDSPNGNLGDEQDGEPEATELPNPFAKYAPPPRINKDNDANGGGNRK